jgi:hypothetical protein
MIVAEAVLGRNTEIAPQMITGHHSIASIFLFLDDQIYIPRTTGNYDITVLWPGDHLQPQLIRTRPPNVFL